MAEVGRGWKSPKEKHFNMVNKKKKKKQNGRSTVVLLTDIDGRTKESRRFNAIVTDTIRLVGETECPEIVRQLSRQFAGLIVAQEKYLSSLLEGKPVDAGQYVRLVNASNRTLKALGLMPDRDDDPDPGMDLDDYLARKKRRGVGTKRKADRRRERLARV